MKDFVHLHVHSEYSLLDGYSKTKDLCARAVELGMDSIALTDHGVMYGAIEFYHTARKAGIKPILGVEAYMATGRHDDRTPQGKGYYHTLLLAQNEVGYRNLVKLTTMAHVNGFYYKPRIDHELLQQYSEGLIVTSSCLAGEINRHLTNKQKEKAREIAAWHRDVLGPERYFLELQLHPGVPVLEELNDELVKIGQELGIPLVVTNDAHFVRKEDAEAHRLIRAMGFNTTLEELCAKEPDLDDSYHLMSGDEMWQIFKRYGPAPLENTRRIADMCNLDLQFGRVKLPDFELPEGHTPSSYLKFVCEEGLVRRLNGNVPEHYVQRLEYELDVINQTGFPLYMLIVWDYVQVARERDIPCLPRGSAGSSLVLYCLGITDVDPIQNKLLFERFLSPERLEMPDIDIDFADSRRHEILEYVAEKYGRDKTAQIITYGTLGAKAALRDVGRVMGVPLSEVDRVAKLIPALPVGVTIAQALERVPELKQISDSDPRMHQLIEWAQSIEGRMRNVGTHACGVVVSADPLDTMVPLQRTTKDENALMAAFEGPTLAELGLLKMDMLGLTNLSVAANALQYISQTLGRKFTLADIPLDDTKTFEGLSRGETTNVFQFEGAGMTRYLRELKPTRVEDLYAMVALYRPGPLEQIPVYIHNKNNPHDIKYLHPILEPILADTYGVIVYQEQIMQLLQSIAGYTLGQAYIVLKAIGKKKKELMAKEEPRFKQGCLNSGLTQAQADQLWDLIQPFAGYSFNRPHSTLYGLLSYQTAYLKFNYPTEYMAAVLSAASSDIESVAKGVAECSRLGVAVLPPEVNTSDLGFTIERLPQCPEGIIYDRGVRFGLSAIKTVGEGPVQAILQTRAEGGMFASLEDFCARVDRQALNKRVLEALIKSGAMDVLPGTRHQKLAIMDKAISAGVEAQRAREAGQGSLFDLLGDGPAAEAATANVTAIPLPALDAREDSNRRREALSWEKELLGMYVSEHPVAHALSSAPHDPGRITLSQIRQAHVGSAVRLIGMFTNTRRIQTKKGDSMLVGMIEDVEGELEFVAFPRTYEQYRDMFADDAIVLLTAKVDFRRDQLQLICENVTTFDTAPPADAQAPVYIPAEEEGLLAFADEAPLPPEPDADDAAWNYEDAPMPPAPMTMSAAAAAPAAVPTNGGAHTNGHTNGNGNGHAAAANGGAAVSIVPSRRRVTIAPPASESAAESAAPAGPRFHLHIYLPRTGDFDTDVARMREIDKILRLYEGEQIVTLYLPNAVGQVLLEPSHGIAPAEALLSQLSAMLGDERVVLEQL